VVVLPAATEKAVRVHFVYHASRSSMELERVVTRAHQFMPRGPERTGRVLAWSWSELRQRLADDPQRAEEVLQLLWQAELVKVVFEYEDETRVLVGSPPERRPMGLDDFTYREAPGPAARHFVDSTRYRDELLATMEQAASPQLAHRRFFAAFDVRTSAELIGTEVPDEDLRSLMINRVGLLRDVLLRNLRRRSFGPDPQVKPGHLVHMREELVWFANLLERTILATYGSLTKHPGGFEEAVVAFANGDLRLRLPCLAWSCQPNSAYFFLLGEAALSLARLAEAEPRLASWRGDPVLRFARAAVRAQLAYVEAYGSYARGLERPADLADYRSFDYSSACALPPAILRELEDAFATRTLGELCVASAEHVRLHLPGWKP